MFPWQDLRIVWWPDPPDMRALLHPLLLLLPALASAQVVTYYVTPPTLGCNGVWAVSGMTMNCGSAPYTYSVDPPGCANPFTMTSDGDTLFIPLCAVPCTLIITNSDGIDCLGSTGTPLTIGTVSASEDLVITTANGNVEITSPQALTSARLRIMDPSGRTLIDQRLSDGDHWIIPAPLQSAGVCIITIDADGVHHVQRSTFSGR